MTSDTFYNWLLQLGLSDKLANTFSFIGAVTALIMVALIANILAKSIIRLVIHPLIRKSRIRWDDRLIQYKLIIRCSHIVPIAIIHLYAPVLFETNPTAIYAINTIVNTYIIVITLMFIDALLNFLRALWEQAEVGKRYPAKSFTQAAKLVINLIGLIFILAAILGKSPL
ncbi:MAG: mechanosensitive ion channel family protein, partial [Verrucomicrobiota bacterium]|nr:mechanosensitive ion channel family protein [Verrucomicrobiota bacterium]